jgi:acetyl-CoA C-acetyltransferase
MNDNVYIVGGYQTDFARNWHKENKHIAAIMREAFEGSVAETEIDVAEIEALLVGNFASELYCMQGHLAAMCVDFDPRLVGIPTMRVEAACASGAAAVLAAMSHILAGMYDLVCVVGVEQMKTLDPARGADVLGTAAWYEREARGVEYPFPKLFGRLGEEYDMRYGLDRKHLAGIAAINHGNAQRNPNAQTRNWFMSFEHANTVSRYNPLVTDTLKASDCCPITDGAACIYLASQAFAQRYARKRGLDFSGIPRIQGWGHTTASMEMSEKLAASSEAPYVLPVTRKAITTAFDRAGISDCWALDVIETHDCFTTSEYMALDHFGLTPPGQSWRAIEEGVIEMGGQLPVNPSGGLLGCGHPVGATGVRQVLDAYKQVAGKAGDYQVENARRAATLNIGGAATTNVCLIIGAGD